MIKCDKERLKNRRFYPLYKHDCLGVFVCFDIIMMLYDADMTAYDTKKDTCFNSTA